MSAWLSAAGCPAIHELLAKVESAEVYLSALDDYVDCCTYAHLVPMNHVRRVIIHRSPTVVALSLEAAGLPVPPNLEECFEVLCDLEGLHVDFDGLDDALGAIHKHLRIEAPFDPNLAHAFSELDIQIRLEDFRARERQLLANYAEIGRLTYS